jgi:catecholate siderophore receptor
VIRGVDSSANFFVNGFRDDVQYFRDLYNTQSVEVLKGPSALIFGRGAGGGLVNRTLKEADWATRREVTAQTGSYFDRRVTRCRPGHQRERRGALQRFLRAERHVPRLRPFRALRRQSDDDVKPADDTKVKL